MDTDATSRPSTREPLVTAQELAEFLGVPVSWVYERSARGAIPRHKVGAYVRFRISEVEAWLADEGKSGGRVG